MLFAAPDDLRRRRLIVGGIAIVLLLSAFLAYAVLVHRSATTPAGVPVASLEVVEPEVPARAPISELPPLTSTAEPEAFARLIAQALFEWDTSTVITRTQHIERLVSVADPTGESSAGLVSDIENYLPASEAWSQLQQYETRQWIEIESASVPSTWAEAEARAGPDGLLPGTTAYTISGIRHRSGVWEDTPVSSAHDVAYTVFIVCGPAYPDCHLLRLSLVDEPLD